MMQRRTFLAGAAGLAGLMPVYGAAHSDRSPASAAVPFDAIVSQEQTNQPQPVFPTISAAVAAAPAKRGRPWRIGIGKGIWRERLVIDKPFIHLFGAGEDETLLVSGASAGDRGADGKPIGTFKTQTVAVTAADFFATALSIANDFDYIGHLPPPVTDDKTGASGSQAIALSLYGKADRCLLQNVTMTGFQDTLFADSGRSLLRNCRITGCVDFIFGAGLAIFEDCEIVSRQRPGQTFNGFIAAPDTDIRQPYGLVFNRCALTKEQGVAPHTVALGRPWRHTRTFANGLRYGDPDNVGACTYVNCRMEDHIVPEGWYPMGYTNREGVRTQMTPQEARFFEYGSTGPGAGAPSASRRFLTGQEAAILAQKLRLSGLH